MLEIFIIKRKKMYSQIIKRNRNINDNNIFLKNYKFKINLLISTKLIILYKIIK